MQPWTADSLDIYLPGLRTGVGGTGICGPGALDTGSGLAKDQSVYVIGSSPHMHKLGHGFKTTHSRGGVELGALSNIPNRWYYDEKSKYLRDPLEVRPGDTLTTECVYSNPWPSFTGFGIHSFTEQCYDFLLVYPIDSARAKCGQGIVFEYEGDGGAVD